MKEICWNSFWAGVVAAALTLLAIVIIAGLAYEQGVANTKSSLSVEASR